MLKILKFLKSALGWASVLTLLYLSHEGMQNVIIESNSWEAEGFDAVGVLYIFFEIITIITIFVLGTMKMFGFAFDYSIKITPGLFLIVFSLSTFVIFSHYFGDQNTFKLLGTIYSGLFIVIYIFEKIYLDKLINKGEPVYINSSASIFPFKNGAVVVRTKPLGVAVKKNDTPGSSNIIDTTSEGSHSTKTGDSNISNP